MPFFEMVRAYIVNALNPEDLLFFGKTKRGEASLRPDDKKSEFPFSKEQFHEHHEAETNHERGKAEMLDAFL